MPDDEFHDGSDAGKDSVCTDLRIDDEADADSSDDEGFEIEDEDEDAAAIADT